MDFPIWWLPRILTYVWDCVGDFFCVHTCPAYCFNCLTLGELSLTSFQSFWLNYSSVRQPLLALSLFEMKRRRRIIPASHYNGHHYMHICEIQTTFLLLLRAKTFCFRKCFQRVVTWMVPFLLALRISLGQLGAVCGWKRKWFNRED